MAHKSGRQPSTMERNIPGQLTSRNVIRTTVSKSGGRADKFVYHKSGCKDIKGSPGTSFIDK